MENQFIHTTALVSSDPQVIEQVQSCFEMSELVDVISEINEAELLSIELPELIIIDYSDWELAFTILDRIIEDPWLHYQNIISICSSLDVSHRLEGHKGINLVAAISRFDILSKIPVVLDLVRKNRQLLFHRGFETMICESITGTFTIHNSLLEIESIINLICSYLFNSNKVETSRKNRLKTALTELLVNALEHGNCGIGYEEKSEWLANGGKISELIQNKLENPDIAKRTIRFHYDINQTYSTFTIEDDGSGFEWKQFTAPDADSLFTQLNGRGIIMAMTSSARLEYNDEGTIAVCSIDHKELSSNNAPAVLSHLDPEKVTEGATILRQGDRSSYLYFITKGRYMVSVDDKPVSILTPDDIFMGEMSFLLNGKRSATITAMTDGSIIRISKREFISVIRDYPYYTLFLARLLAQRLNRSNG